MEYVVIWILLSLIPAAIASGKGHSFGGYFLLSLLLSPLIGLIIALVASKDTKKLEASQVASGQSKKCPYCAEIIKKEAVVCKHCGRDLLVKEAAVVTSNESPETPS